VRPDRGSKILAAVVTGVVSATVVTAVIVIGAPSQQRLKRMDAVRVQDLGSLASAVRGYFARHATLPASLSSLAKEPGYRVASADPETGQPFGYEIINPTTYRLCGEFSTDSAKDPPDNGYYDVTWAHGRGRQCFERHADKAD
jgi:hypothetical protein